MLLPDINRVQTKWYYSIELQPNVFSNGRLHGTCSLVRSLLDRCDLTGLRCIDIGAQEGLNSVLMAQKDASSVVAYDFVDLRDRIAMVQQAYDVQFSYFHSTPLYDLPEKLDQWNKRMCDFVLFAGVLYHLTDPIGGLANVRSLLRNGGLMLLETSALIHEDSLMKLNTGGRFYKGSNYWQISLPALEYLLRMMHLQPLDVAYIKPPRDSDVCRCVVLCRAMDSVQPVGDDPWLKVDWAVKNCQYPHLDFDRLKARVPEMPYQAQNPHLVFHPGSNHINLYETVVRSPGHTVNREHCALRLSKQPITQVVNTLNSFDNTKNNAA